MKSTTNAALPAQNLVLDLVHTITMKTIEGTEKLIALQLQASRSLLEDMASQAHAFADLKDPQKLVTHLTSMSNPAGEKISAYARQAYEISTETRDAITETIQKHIHDGQAVTHAWIESAAKTAPAGSEPMFAAARNALSLVRASLDHAAKVGQQAAESTDSHVVATSTAVKPSARTRKAA
jgi:phasin family protein